MSTLAPSSQTTIDLEIVKSVKVSKDSFVVKEKRGTLGVVSATISLLNNMVGTGFITLPFAMASVGIFQGFLIESFALFLTVISLQFISSIALKLGRNTDYNSAFGKYFPKAQFLVDLTIFFQSFCSVSSSLILIGNTLPTIYNDLNGVSSGSILSNRSIWIVLVALFIGIPLSLIKSFKSLRFVSIASLSCVFFIAFLLLCSGVLELLMGPSKEIINNISLWSNSFSNTLMCLSYYVYAFSCQKNFFRIISEMKTPNKPVNTIVIVMAAFLGAMLYGSVSLLGYIAFGNNVTTNPLVDMTGPNFRPYLEKFDPHLISSVIGRLCVVFISIMGIPWQVIPCRNTFNSLINRTKYFKKLEIKKKPITDNGKYNKFLSIAIVILGCFVALAISNFGIFISVVGATLSTMISFIFPASLYLAKVEKKKWGVKKSLALFLVVFSFMYMFLMLVNIFIPHLLKLIVF